MTENIEKISTQLIIAEIELGSIMLKEAILGLIEDSFPEKAKDPAFQANKAALKWQKAIIIDLAKQAIKDADLIAAAIEEQSEI